MNKISISTILLLIVVAGVYFMNFSPSAKLKSAAKQPLQQFSDAVAAKDRTKVKAVLTDSLDDKAKIRLKFEMVSIIQQMPPINMDLDKAGFIAFIDNTLANMTEYSYEYRMGVLALADDKKTANLKFSSKEWSDGMGAYGATQVVTRFSSNTECDSTLTFVDKAAKLSALDCTSSYRAVPKTSELEKVKDQLKDQIQQINKDTAVPPQPAAKP